jgi:radical SAM protein with 4Fe4S-binding SPASM domain
MDYAKKKRPNKNAHWRIVSNFSLLDETIASFLKKNKVMDLCTSLDGPEKLHNRNRPLHGGSYKKTVHWINALRQDFGYGKIGVLATITKHSLPYWKEIVGEYCSLGLPDITPVPIRKAGRAIPNWEKIGFEPKDYVAFWKSLVGECIAKTRDGSKITEQFTLMIAQKLLGKGPAFHTCFSKPCGAALMQASYQPDGSIYTCDEGKAFEMFRLGSISQKYKEVFASPAALNMVSLSSSLGMLCNECKWNAYCCFCPVMAFASQGSPIPLLYNNADCIIRKGQFSFVFEKLFSIDKPIILNWLEASKSL